MNKKRVKIFMDKMYYGYSDHRNKFIIHNEDGPAVIYKGREREWWIDGNDITIKVRQWANERNLDLDNLCEEDKLALSFYLKSLK